MSCLDTPAHVGYSFVKTHRLDASIFLTVSAACTRVQAVEETKAASSLAAAEAIVAEYKQGLEVNMEESQASRWVPSVALLLASLAYCMQY